LHSAGDRVPYKLKKRTNPRMENLKSPELSPGWVGKVFGTGLRLWLPLKVGGVTGLCWKGIGLHKRVQSPECPQPRRGGTWFLRSTKKKLYWGEGKKLKKGCPK